MSQPISREEFTAFTTRLYATIDDGFNGTHRRLDTLNGRIGKNEVDVAAHDVRVSALEDFKDFHLHRRSTDADGGGFTTREKALGTLGIGLLLAAFKLALLVGQFVIQFWKSAFQK